MTSNSPLLSPQQRLAHSREAIVCDMSRDEAQSHEPRLNPDAAGDGQIDASSSTWDLIKQVGSAWWGGHPAHLALDLAKPMIQTYAEKNPLKLLGISAGIGVAAVVTRPWRLISLTGLLLATLKSTEVSGVIKTLFSSGRA